MLIQQIVLFFEAAALVAAFINYRKLKANGIGIFLFSLPIICMVEWGSNVFHLLRINNSPLWAYNYVVHPTELLCYSYVYYHYFKETAIRKRVLILAVLTAILMIIDACFLQATSSLQTYAYIFMCCVFVYFAYLYFNTIIYANTDKKLRQSAYFWISIGCLLFFSAEAPLFAFYEYFNYQYIHMHKGFPSLFSNTFMILSNIVNYILYTCLTIAFFCRTK